MLQNELLTWLDKEMERRHLNDSLLLKRAELSHSVISKARNDIQEIGWEACIRIADALNLPPQTVLVKAGHLPQPKDSWTPEEEEMIRLFAQVDPTDRDMILGILRHRLQKE
jgi:hypothetical protein